MDSWPLAEHLYALARTSTSQWSIMQKALYYCSLTWHEHLQNPEDLACRLVARNGRLIEMLTGVRPLPSDNRSTVACRMDCILGLQGREAKNVSMACCSVKPRHQYMYASAVAGALPNPAM